MPQESQEDKVLASFLSYIDAFNAEDIQGVRDHIDETIEIFVNGKQIGQGQGRDKLLPMWQADMDLHKRVEITKGPVCTVKGEIAEIDVELTATVKRKGEADVVQVVPVLYVIDATTMLHTRHQITLQ